MVGLDTPAVPNLIHSAKISHTYMATFLKRSKNMKKLLLFFALILVLSVSVFAYDYELTDSYVVWDVNKTEAGNNAISLKFNYPENVIEGVTLQEYNYFVATGDFDEVDPSLVTVWSWMYYTVDGNLNGGVQYYTWHHASTPTVYRFDDADDIMLWEIPSNLLDNTNEYNRIEFSFSYLPDLYGGNQAAAAEYIPAMTTTWKTAGLYKSAAAYASDGINVQENYVEFDLSNSGLANTLVDSNCSYTGNGITVSGGGSYYTFNPYIDLIDDMSFMEVTATDITSVHCFVWQYDSVEGWQYPEKYWGENTVLTFEVDPDTYFRVGQNAANSATHTSVRFFKDEATYNNWKAGVELATLGAQKRTDGTAGLRFGAQVNFTNAIADLAAVQYAGEGDTAYAGFVIIPANLLNGDLTVATEGAAVVKAANIYASDAESATFTAVVTDIPVEAEGVDLTAVPFVNVNGTYYYGTAITRTYAAAGNTLA